MLTSAALLVGVTAPPAVAQVRGLVGCANAHATNEKRLGTTPAGPATSAITGHTVTTTFALGGDELVAAPPPAGYVPAVSYLQAGCELASAVGVSGKTPASGRLALATLTLRTDLPTQLWIDPSINSRLPALGAVPVYQDRVAWILVSPVQVSCFSTTAQPPTLAPNEVTAVDAATGASAVFYQDALPPCAGTSTPALVSIPYQTVSLPWHLVSRAKNQGHAKVTASWASCEKFTWAGYRRGEFPPNFPTPAQQAHDAATFAPYETTMSHRPLWTLSISVNRPIGPPCGAPKKRVITVFPQELDKTLSKEMRHAALGAVITQQY
ncbi:hypothetical protein acdb102_29380 [Acidothermaceae bacterium B102]|nr:hypothetical protein acdb102_29380 [Acidothermaceae bacterium B102]